MRVELMMMCLTLSSSSFGAASAPSEDLVLWYTRPAARWVEALPVGNGRLGGMVFGGVGRERIQLNEDSLWSGGPQDADNPASLENLGKVRQLLAEKKFTRAAQLAVKTMVCKGVGSNKGTGAYVDYGSYQTLGDLRFEFDGHAGAPADYKRSLDLDTAIAGVSYRLAG
ncbi:MAG: glycoside hydrolase family 95 protein, partial [Phycisphaerae bacterium]|nr:glycoside hydrolase family 95 protein [Phycisphaerae bacterium]